MGLACLLCLVFPVLLAHILDKAPVIGVCRQKRAAHSRDATAPLGHAEHNVAALSAGKSWVLFSSNESGAASPSHRAASICSITSAPWAQRQVRCRYLWEMVKHGLGVGIQDGIIGDQEPMVRRVLPDLESLAFSMWLVTHREVNTSRRIRVVFDLLADKLSGS
jgi:DNA-binding transcriptional LysR family regulator